MPASTGFDSEPKIFCSTEEEHVSTGGFSSSFKGPAWDTFRANLKQRHQRAQSQSSSSASPTRFYKSMAKSSNNNTQKRLHDVPRSGDEEESKFGKSLIGLMQRSGRFDYCDFSDSDQTQQEKSDDDNSSSNNGSVRRLMKAAGVRLTWQNLTNQIPCFIRKALSSRSPR